MKLVTFKMADRTSIGKVVGDRVIDLAVSSKALPSTMRELLAGGEPAMAAAREVSDGASYALREVELLAPIPNPSKYLAVGLNYRKHAEEAKRLGMTIPKTQLWFNKQVSCIHGPYAPMHLPAASDKLDYEAELGVVIGKRCRHVSVENARSVIAGYMVCNDVSVRDYQLRTQTMTLGKSFDTHGPIGPWIATDDEVPDPHALRIRAFVNGEVRQDSNTSDMLFNIYEQVSYLSSVMTLEPGDVLATGTPSGVGVGMVPPTFLKVGDVVRIEIETVGHIENEVIPEPMMPD